jgi:hypothetical protein
MMFVADMRALDVRPHIAQNVSGRRSAIDARTTRHGGYMVSQQKRKRIEEPFGWGKTIGGLGQPMLRAVKKLSFKFALTMAGSAKAHRRHSMSANKHQRRGHHPVTSNKPSKTG